MVKIMVDSKSCGRMHIVGLEVNHEDFGEASVCLVFFHNYRAAKEYRDIKFTIHNYVVVFGSIKQIQ